MTYKVSRIISTDLTAGAGVGAGVGSRTDGNRVMVCTTVVGVLERFSDCVKPESHVRK